MPKVAVYKVALFCCEIYSNTSVYSSPFFLFLYISNISSYIRPLLHISIPLWWNNLAGTRNHLPPDPPVAPPRRPHRRRPRSALARVCPRGATARHAVLCANSVSCVFDKLPTARWRTAAPIGMLQPDGRVPTAGPRAAVGRTQQPLRERVVAAWADEGGGGRGERAAL